MQGRRDPHWSAATDHAVNAVFDRATAELTALGATTLTLSLPDLAFDYERLGGFYLLSRGCSRSSKNP